jgi:murein DD-endopeptidase MepM/ murein hydrolase activator NlpD
MESRLHPSRRLRLILIQVGLLLSVALTGTLVHRQSLLLPETSAAPRSTPAPEFASLPTRTGLTPTPGQAVSVPKGPRAKLIDDTRFFYAENYYAAQIQAFLDKQPGPLKSFRAQLGDQEESFAELLASRTVLYSLNPQVVLALIEQQSGLITQPDASPERLDWALNFHGEDEHWRGLLPQVRWATREMYRAQRDFPSAPELNYADASHSPVPAGLNVGGYAIARVLAATTSAAELPARLDGGPSSFVATFTRLFGDPREAVPVLHEPAAPFLSLPLDRMYAISSFFDHDTPYLQTNGSIVTYRGDRSETLSYDGHTGWDYAAKPPAPVLAAASGTVVFAGNADDNCGAKAVIIDHGNGYRTLYWHLDEVLAKPGPVERGARIGVVGSSGCATGPHLHFQVEFLGQNIDPYGWCGPTGKDPWANHPAGVVNTWLWSYMPSPCHLPADAVVVEPGDPQWSKRGSGWETVAGGVGGSVARATSVVTPTADTSTGVWQPALPAAGRYRVLAWIPYVESDIPDATAVRYLVHHAGGEAPVVVDQSAAVNNWVDLGTYQFQRGQASFVRLEAVDANAPTNVWFDAVIWLPVK